jgi:hypothetical protein
MNTAQSHCHSNCQCLIICKYMQIHADTCRYISIHTDTCTYLHFILRHFWSNSLVIATHTCTYWHDTNRYIYIPTWYQQIQTYTYMCRYTNVFTSICMYLLSICMYLLVSCQYEHAHMIVDSLMMEWAPFFLHITVLTRRLARRQRHDGDFNSERLHCVLPGQMGCW